MLTRLNLFLVKTPPRGYYCGNPEDEKFYAKLRSEQRLWRDIEVSVQAESGGQVSSSVWSVTHNQIDMRGYAQFKNQIYWPMRRALADKWWGF